MSIPAIAPSPLARLLLELEARRATAGVDVGGRRVVLARGLIVDVRPYAGDPTLGAFLVEAGRLSADDLSAATADAATRGTPLETVLRERELLDADALSAARRALWLDRFVRGLATDEARGSAPSAVTPEPAPPSGTGVATLPFVLDALSRRAGFDRDAERVGQLAETWFEWRESAEAARARVWAELGSLSEPIRTAQLFARHPAAPSRIAALVRAGMARLSEGKPQVPPPETRPPAIVGPVHDPRNVELVTETRAQSPTKPDNHADRPLAIPKLASWLPKSVAELDDPLDALERRIAQLEQSGAPAEERARAWLELGEAFRFHLDSIDESARASREAAAADPNNVDALDAAATLSAATGKPNHAYQYARALAESLTGDDHARAAALVRAYHYGRRARLAANALGALHDAHTLVPDHPGIAELYARALFEQGERERGVSLAREAAQTYALERPEQALFVLWWAAELAPDDAALTADLSAVLAQTGRHEAALAVAARAARNAPEAAEPQRLVVSAAARAEHAGRPDLAFDTLLETLDRPNADRDALWDVILKTLSSVGSAADLAVIAASASLEGAVSVRATRLALAADARLVLTGDTSLAVELYTLALSLDPSHAGALNALEQLAKAEGQKRVLMDAIERAIAAHRDDGARADPLRARLLELALRSDDGAPMLARSLFRASAQLREAHPDESARAEQDAARDDEAIGALERDVRNASPNDRVEGLLRVALRMRDDPARRPRARKLLEYVLEKRPEHVEASAALESVLRLMGERDAVESHWAQRALTAADPSTRLNSSLKQAYTALLAEDRPQAFDALAELLRNAPRHREGLALLTRMTARGDPARYREALERRLEVGLDPRERARTAVTLAHHVAAQGDLDAAARFGELSLTLDPRSGEAALLVLDHHERLDAQRRAGLLRVAHAVLGAGPTLMRALSRDCFVAHDPHGQRTALETYARFSPFDALPALGLCALHATGQEARPLMEAVRLAIDPGRHADTTTEAVRVGIAKLWTLAPLREVSALLLDATDALGENGTALLTWSLPSVREAGDPRLVRAVLERLVARVRGDGRRAELRRLAHFCRDHGMRAAEARAYLRLLAVEPSDDEALTRLAAIYAETREVERLMAVLTVRLNGARDADERRTRLLSLALTSLDLAADATSAVSLLRAALGPEVALDGTVRDCPLPALRRGVGMLLGAGAAREAFDILLELSADASPERARLLIAEAVVVAEEDLDDADLSVRTAMLGLESFPAHEAFLEHIERVAPPLGNLTALRDTYKQLADATPEVDRKKALLARGVFTLERIGAVHDAIDLAERVLAISPSDELAFTHLERLATSGGRFEPIVRALVLRAGQEPDAEKHAGFLARGAALCDEEGHDPVRASALYVHAYTKLPNEHYEQRAMDVLMRLGDRDPSATQASVSAMRDALTRQAKSLDAPAARTRALAALAELTLDLLRDDEDAASYAQAGRAALEGASELDAEQREALRGRLDAVLMRTSARRESRAHQPSAGGAMTARARRIAEADRELRALDDAEGLTLNTTPHGGSERRELVQARLVRSAPLNAEDEGLVRGIMSGSAAALERLSASRDGNFDRSAALSEALLLAVRSEGPSVSALRGLRVLGEHVRRRDIAAVVGEAFAFFDPPSGARAPTRLPSPTDEATRGALTEAREDGSLAPAFAVLYHVYTAATPLFRKPLASYGVSASDFIGHGEYGARGEALEDVTRVLGLEYEAYLATSGRAAIDVVATAPASIVIGGEVPADRAALRFRIAAAFERARPQNALLATLGENDAVVLVAAIRAAFAAPLAEPADVPREPASMAAELWRTMPGQAQRQVEQTLRSLKAELDARVLRAQLARRAARVGLVVAGSLTVALEQLGIDDDPRPARLPTGEAAFADALVQREDVRDLLRFALSDSYLALRSRESS